MIVKTSRVPQSSVFEDCYFFTYVNDLLLKSNPLFADDVILYNTSWYRSAIEQDLISIKIWGENCQMSFNVAFN